MTARRLPFPLILPLSLIMLLASFWGTLAIWFKMPGPDLLRYVVIGFFVFLNGAAFIALFKTRHLRPFLVFAGIFALLLGWWSTLTPPSEGNWVPDVARQVTGEIDGDLVTLTNIRDFEWTSAQEGKTNWITGTYDLSQLETVDMLLSYWGSPNMAHFILSYGFADGRQLAWSIEVKRSVGHKFSPVEDFFRANPLVIIAATERDVVGVRTNYRNQDVLMLRIAREPAQIRSLFEEYVKDANKLAARPAWYNTIETNCTTVVVRMLDAIGGKVDFDWRILVNGYLPEYVYEKGSVVNNIPIEELLALSRISPKAQAVGLSDAARFSAAIREGVPGPPVRSGVTN